jgi:hypothetical protein
VDLFSRSCVILRFVTFNASQAKKRSYCNQHITFFHLIIEVFGCLHKHINVFLLDYANAIWSFKGTEGLHLSTLVTFLPQKVSITLQRMQASSILSRVIVIGLATFRLSPLQDTLIITTVDVLQAVDF